MLRRVWLSARVACLVVCLLLCTTPLWALGRYQGYVSQGGAQLLNSGIFGIKRGATTFTNPYMQQSYPQATVTVFIAGTVTPATLYSSTSLTPLANPFTASTNGYYTFFAAEGLYDLQFSGSGIAAPFTQFGIQVNSVASSLVVAACPSDGVADATACLQTAIAGAIAITARGGELYIPAGKYLFSSLDLAGFSCDFAKTLLIRGAGSKATQLIHSATGVAIDMSGANQVVWEDIGLQANVSQTSKVGFLLARLTDSRESVGGCATWPLNSPFSGNNSFERVRIDGAWTQAGFACMACENLSVMNSNFLTTGAGTNEPAVYVSDSNPTIFDGATVGIVLPKVGGTITQSAVFSTINNHFLHTTFTSANSGSTVFLFNRTNIAGVLEAEITDSSITYNGNIGFNASGIVYQSNAASSPSPFGLKVSGTLFELNGGDAIIAKSTSGTATFSNFGVFRGNLFTQSSNIISVSGGVDIENLVYEGNTEFTGFAATPTLRFNGAGGSIVGKSYIRAAGPGTVVDFNVNTVAPGTVVIGRTITTAGSLHGAKLVTLGDYATPFLSGEERYKGWPAAAPARTWHQVWEPYQGLFANALMDGTEDSGRILTGDGVNLIPGSTNTGTSTVEPSIFGFTSGNCCWNWMRIVPTTSIPSSSADGTAKFTNVGPGNCIVNATDLYCKMTDSTWRKFTGAAF